MIYDFNVLERAAKDLFNAARFRDALRIYFYMSDGDPSLDGGYLGKKIAECYEQLGELYAARYWYGRAVAENPAVNAACNAARERLGPHIFDDLIPISDEPDSLGVPMSDEP